MFWRPIFSIQTFVDHYFTIYTFYRFASFKTQLVSIAR